MFWRSFFWKITKKENPAVKVEFEKNNKTITHIFYYQGSTKKTITLPVGKWDPKWKLIEASCVESTISKISIFTSVRILFMNKNSQRENQSLCKIYFTCKKCEEIVIIK